MGKSWQKMDLEGAGVQALSLMLAKLMVSRPKAYALWVLFPLGAHRFYLRENIGWALYMILTLATAGIWWSVGGWYPLVTLVPMIAMALYDLWWIDGRVAEYNKELRKSLYLSAGSEAAAPKDFSGRFRDADEYESQLKDYVAEKEQGDSGKRKRAPSLNEQEAMLKAMQKSRSNRSKEQGSSDKDDTEGS